MTTACQRCLPQSRHVDVQLKPSECLLTKGYEEIKYFRIEIRHGTNIAGVLFLGAHSDTSEHIDNF